METVSQMRTRHKAERSKLFLDAVRTTGSVEGACNLIQTDRGVVYRELAEAGVTANELTKASRQVSLAKI